MWSLLFHLERVFSSIQLYGSDIEDGRLLYTKDVAIDIKKSGVYADLHPSKFQELMKFCFPLKEAMYNSIMKPMKQLNLSTLEFSYMVAYMMFNVYEVRNLSDETVTIGEHLLDHFSSELHNYYVFEQHLTSYASRLARMLRLISFAKQHSSHIKDYMIMAKVFDIFICDIYESELFE
uniref:NR LBD domain-containing protein n=1 Tax=Panagrellus redivivus TaxID=6233 RepID=A0A7E4W698_PANRE